MAPAPTTRALEAPQRAVRRLAEFVRSGTTGRVDGELHLGIDLGTANIVLSVVDAHDSPVSGAWLHSTVVRDGVVVDWAGATSAVRRLRGDLERRLDTSFSSASVSIPPGISDGDIRVFRNVAQACELDVTELVDEPVAAARALGITDGAVIDIGHGTTGVSVLEGGRVLLSVDEPTGGHHMTLVLAGAHRIGYQEAEAMKKNPARRNEVLGVIVPTLEKMAAIAAHALGSRSVPVVYLVGGASSLPNAPEVFEEWLGRPVVRPDEPMFVTPLGVPMSAKKVLG